ncbi:hypothetical protein HDU79_011975, partial [Rhizoclosmatium sp. JEL0117]
MRHKTSPIDGGVEDLEIDGERDMEEEEENRRERPVIPKVRTMSLLSLGHVPPPVGITADGGVDGAVYVQRQGENKAKARWATVQAATHLIGHMQEVKKEEFVPTGPTPEFIDTWMRFRKDTKYGMKGSRRRAAKQVTAILEHPVSAFRRRMAAVRNTYRGSAVLDAKEAALKASLEAADRKAASERLLRDIADFKAAHSFSAFDSTGSASGSGSGSSTKVDVVKDALGLSSTKATTTSTTTQSQSQSQTQSYIRSRASIRAKTESQRQASLATTRTNKLLYLLYTTDSFVTKATLDRRIDDCLVFEFSRSSASHASKADFAGRVVDYKVLERLAKQKLSGADAGSADNSQISDYESSDEFSLATLGILPKDGAEKLNNSNNNKPAHSHATVFSSRLSSTKGTRSHIAQERRTILADAVNGTIMGRSGVDTIEASVKGQ